MRLGRRQFAASVLLFGVACTAPQLLAKRQRSYTPDSSDEKRALQALNRLTFGPRPEDLQQVMALGVDRWIDLQLHPERIDDSALNSRLGPFRTLRMSPRQIAEDFPDPQEINQVMNGKRAMPSDPARRAIYEVQLAKLRARKERKEEEIKTAIASTAMAQVGEEQQGTMLASAGMEPGISEPSDHATMKDFASSAASGESETASASSSKPALEERKQPSLHEKQAYSEFEFEELNSLPADERYKKILAMPPDELVSFASSLRGGKGLVFVEGMSPEQKETLLALNNPTAVVDNELEQTKLLRAIYSQRQLEEVMTDFWCNHFNVFIGKGLDHVMLTSYERDVIRAHAFGRFEDLLVATAKSPAMLFYLDNWLSVGPNSAQALGIATHGAYAPRAPARPGKRPSGLNENYGRELLELHTLSVNGGYTQRDVTEVAKVFTGWTIDKPAQGGGFKFEPRMHEPGPKFVLGHRIKEKGEDEGLELLHRLATSRQTAHFISLKLAERFVSDDPPPALVDRMAKTFLKKKGDIREVLSVLFHSPEFWDDTSYRAKVKTPLEFVASSVRATGAEVDDAMPLTRQLNNMGMPLYGAQPPTGYSMKADAWVSSAALLNRMNFALALTSGRIRGVQVDASRFAPDARYSDPSMILSAFENRLIAGGVSEQTHDSIVAQIQETKGANPSTIAGLLLGSPEFQKR
jgi:uncharacterized protein (DUF1800 family)